ncbi:TPA: Bro-N domain-containing protein [Klebsiella aerogenes]|nr:Bro-N domain-containing protein [Klebsiella aerogenes]
MKSIAKAQPDFTRFKFGDNDIRVINKDGEPWFVAKDVCKAIGLTNSRASLLALDDDEKGVSSIYTPGGEQNISVVSESGMYTLVLRCRDAVNRGSVPHKFRKWVTAEVLPSIRKHGEYVKGKKTTVEERTPLRDAVNLLVGKKGLRYDDAYNMVHQRFNIDSIDELELEQIPLAVEYLHRVALEGELLPSQSDLPLNMNKQFNDSELYDLVCLWSISLILKEDSEEILPALQLLGSDWARKISGNLGMLTGFIERAGRLLQRESHHIATSTTPPINWRLELARMQKVLG